MEAIYRRNEMAKVTGSCEGSRRIDGVWSVVEYVRTESDDVFMRTTSRMGKGKWVLDGYSYQESVHYNGNTWCVHPRVLEHCSRYRLPKG
jgi:hypothetical protein